MFLGANFVDIYLQGMHERRGFGWGLVLSVIWPIFLTFSVNICKILMLSVLKKLTAKCSKVLEQ